MGHALDNTMQDILIRYKRMQGYQCTVAAGNRPRGDRYGGKGYSEDSKSRALIKNDIGREEFLKHAWEWKEEYGGRIVNQLKETGFFR